MSSKIFTILSIVLVGLVAVKTTTAQVDQSILDQLNASLQALMTQAQNASTDILSQLTNQIATLLQTLNSIVNPPNKLPCGTLKNGTQYYLQNADGKFAIVDASNQLGFMKLNSQTGAAKFTAFEKSCNVYELSVGGMFMSRCESCPSPLNDYQGVKFHLTDGNKPWSQWTLSTPTGSIDGQLNLKVDRPYYLVSTPNGDHQLSLSTVPTNKATWFKFVEVPPNCGSLLQNGDQYYLQGGPGLYAVLDVQSQLAHMQNVPLSQASKFTVKEYACGVYGFLVDGHYMSRCEACPSPTKDYQSVRFHLTDADSPCNCSQWNVSLTGEESPRKYFLNVIDLEGAYLYHAIPTEQITLFTQFNLNANVKFDLIPAVY